MALAAFVGAASCAHTPDGESGPNINNWGIEGDPCLQEVDDLHLLEMRRKGLQFLDRLEVDLYAKRQSLVAPAMLGLCAKEDCKGAVSKTNTKVFGVTKGQDAGALTCEAFDRDYGTGDENDDQSIMVYDNRAAAGAVPKELALKFFDGVRQGGRVLHGQESHVTVNGENATFGIYNYGSGALVGNVADVPEVEAASVVMCLKQRINEVLDIFEVKR